MMSNKAKKADFLSAFGIPAAVIFSYITALCMLPSSGVLTSLPFPFIFAFVISIFCKDRRIIYISMVAMPFITTLLLGYDMKRAVVSAVIAGLSAYFALLGKRAYITLKKSDNSSVKNKSKAVLVLSLAASAIIWLVCLGNPVSFVLSQNANNKLADERYPGKLETGATYFEVCRFEYLTEIKFDNNDGGKRYYISCGNTDDYKDYHMAETLLEAIDDFAGKTALAKDYIKCYINKDNFIFGDSTQNYINAEFLIERTESVTGRTSFRRLYESLMVYADESDDLEYKSIIMTAYGMDGRKYYAFKEFGKEAVMSVENDELEKEIAEKFN